jgi:hypothetical protein
MGYRRRNSAERIGDSAEPKTEVTLQVRMPRAKIVNHTIRIRADGRTKFFNHDPRADRTMARLHLAMKQAPPESYDYLLRKELMAACRCWQVFFWVFRHGALGAGQSRELTLKEAEAIGIRDENATLLGQIDTAVKRRFMASPNPRKEGHISNRRRREAKELFFQLAPPAKKLPGWHIRDLLMIEERWKLGQRKALIEDARNRSYGTTSTYVPNSIGNMPRHLAARLQWIDAAVEAAFHPFQVIMRREMAVEPSVLSLANQGLLVLDNRYVTQRILQRNDVAAEVEAWVVDWTEHPTLSTTHLLLEREGRAKWGISGMTPFVPFKVWRDKTWKLAKITNSFAFPIFGVPPLEAVAVLNSYDSGLGMRNTKGKEE